MVEWQRYKRLSICVDCTNSMDKSTTHEMRRSQGLAQTSVTVIQAMSFRLRTWKENENFIILIDCRELLIWMKNENFIRISIQKFIELLMELLLLWIAISQKSNNCHINLKFKVSLNLCLSSSPLLILPMVLFFSGIWISYRRRVVRAYITQNFNINTRVFFVWH